MAKVKVELKITCWATVEVEVEDPHDFDAVSDAAFAHDDAPGGITIGAFGPSAGVDTDEWEIDSITDSATDAVIWTEQSGYAKSGDTEVTAEIKPNLPEWVDNGPTV